jgi:hypothetical protein
MRCYQAVAVFFSHHGADVAGAPTVPAYKLLVASSFGRGLAPPQCPVIFWSLIEDLILALWSPSLGSAWGPRGVFSHLQEVPADLCLSLLSHQRLSCLLPNDRDSQVVQETHSGSALRWQWQPPAGTYHRFEFFLKLVAVSCGQMLVPSLVLQYPNSLLICHSFRISM